MRVYIAGPMTGIPERNFPAFFAAAERWRAAGHEVVNPASLDLALEAAHGGKQQEWWVYMTRDLHELTSGIDAVALLPGWQQSQGASVEATVAAVLRIDLYDAESGRRILPVAVDLKLDPKWGAGVAQGFTGEVAA